MRNRAISIVHPLRVMETCKRFTSDITILAAALLHDVLEDTNLSKQEMLSFLETVLEKERAQRTVQLVVELTDVFTKANYPQYRRRKRKALEADRVAKTSPDAQTIKYADIVDNAPEVVDKDPDFARVFLFEYKTLLKRIPNGNQELYKKAVDVVNESITRLGIPLVK